MSLITVNWKSKVEQYVGIVITGVGQRFEGNSSHGSAYDFSGDGRQELFPCDLGRTKTLREQRRLLLMIFILFFRKKEVCDKMYIWREKGRV